MQNCGFSIFKFNNQKITDAFTSYKRNGSSIFTKYLFLNS